MNYKGLLCTACLMCLGLFMSAQPTLSINSGDGDPGDSFTAEITVEDFTNLVSAQFSINWDPNVISYESTQDIVSGLDGFSAGSIGDFIGNTDNGIITVSWNDPLFEPASLSDDEVLFSLTFEATGEACDSSFIAFSGSPLSIEVLDESELNVGLIAENGLFKITGEDCEPVDPEDGGYIFRLECGDIEVGSQICIPVIVDSFILINSIQLGLLFDENVFEFVECQSGELPGFSAGNCSSPDAGQIRVIWTDPEVNGSTLDDGATAFSLCFTVIGDIGDMGTIEFSEVPITCEITDVNGDITSEVTKTGCDYTIVGPMVDPLVLVMDTVSGCQGDTVCVAITVENFLCMESLQFGMAFDSNVIRVIGELLPSDPISGLNGSSFSFPPITPANNVRFVWSFGGMPETLNDGDTLFSMCFLIVGEDGASSSVSIVPVENLDIEHSGCNGVFNSLEQEIGGVMVDCSNNLTCRDVVITDVLCFGGATGAINISVAGGVEPYEFLWSNNATTEDVENLIAGQYSVIVSDAEGNEEPCGPFTVAQNDNLVLNEVITISECGGSTGAINTTPTGGTPPYSFLWSNGDFTEDLINVAANTYTVTVIDSNDCEYDLGPFIVDSEFGIEQVVVTNVACMTENTGSIDLILCGTATSITWTKDGDFLTVAQNISGLEPAVYAVTVTDGIDTYTGSWTIIEEMDLVLSGVDITDENMGSDGAIDITISGGTEPYTYLWSNGATTEDISNLVGGCYSVIVTDVNGCETEFSGLCVDSEELIIDVSVTDISCNGAMDGGIVLIPFNGTAPFTYSWSTPGLEGSDVLISEPGLYQVIVMDSDGKEATLEIGVNEPGVVIAMVNTNCATTETSNDGVFRAIVAGGTEPYSYLWNNNPSETGIELDGVAAGDEASLMVTDANGCTLFTNDIGPMCIGPDVPCFTGRKVITPNNDDKNDALIIACLTGFDRLEIFNRVGERVWFMDAYDNTWMGTDLSGADLPDGVYYWVLFVSNNLNQEVFYKGDVTLLRNLD